MLCSALLPGVEVPNGVCSGAGAPNNEGVVIPGFPNTEPPASFVGWIPKTEVCGVVEFEPRLNVKSGLRSPAAAAGVVPEGLGNEKLGAAPPALAPAVDDDANEKVDFVSVGLAVVDVLVAGNPNGWLDAAGVEPQAVLPNALVVGAAGVVVVAAGAEAEGVGPAPKPEKVGWVVVAWPDAC